MRNDELTQAQVMEALMTILDPEFGLSIVDLGLIYDVRIEGRDVAVAMTLTSPACPAGTMLLEGARAACERLPGVGNVLVELVWSPPWTPERLSAAGREQVGWTSPEE